ncbi:MAG: DUF1697 domain-containing protein [Actinomycetota bacterium]|nr:DUF1697 domain-containing protein [Actinomycetota bacterium]
MPRHVALLRGINVGGHNKVAMADLRRPRPLRRLRPPVAPLELTPVRPHPAPVSPVGPVGPGRRERGERRAGRGRASPRGS